MSNKFAILSVTDKTGLVAFAKVISKTHTLIASGGTAAKLMENNIDIIEVKDFTGFPEIFNGRVKTLHPKIYGGILSRRTGEDLSVMQEMQIQDIDIVVCNLYQFENAVEQQFDETKIIEEIDIGGPTLIRAAAKNYKHVSVLVDPADYETFTTKYDFLTVEDRFTLAAKAFNLMAKYDVAIAEYFNHKNLKSVFTLTKPKYVIGHHLSDLRYGENPHQAAEVYRTGKELFFTKVSGNKEPSYNNILDVREGYSIVSEFDEPTCAIIKHRTPCGLGSDPILAKAYEKALATDKLSAYGGVYCFNREIDKDTAVLLVQMFVDTLFAPGYTEDALTILQQKEKTLILRANQVSIQKRDYHEIPGGFVLQDHDARILTENDWEVVSEHKPDEFEINELLFAWKVVKNSRSNAIVVSRGTEALGIGSGQTSRVDAAKQAIQRAGTRVAGAVLASDAFFPFRDTVDLAAKSGVKAIIVPKGSIRDQESIDAANEHGLVLVHTKIRAFKH